jgi:membrane fusion protein
MLFPRRFQRATTAQPQPPAATLFRAAAVAFQTTSRGGAVHLTRPISVTVLTLFMAALAAVLIAFIVYGEYSRKESVAGFLEPVRGVIRIHPQRGGVISAVLVREGQRVTRNQLLFKVAAPQTMADGSDADRKLLTGIAQQRTALRIARERESQRADSARAKLAAQTSALRRQLDELRTLERLQLAQRQLAKRRLEALRTLYERGAIAEMQWLSSHGEHLATQEKLQSTRALRSRVRGELATLESGAAALRYEAADRTAALDAQLATLQTSAVAIESRRDFAVRAPIAGRVMTLQRKVGEPAAPTQLVLTIVPDDSPLVGRLLIPTRAIGFVAPGQRVQLRFDAFPYQHFGTHPGVLAAVAATVLFSGDSFGPLAVNQPAYPATVAIPDQGIAANGRTVPLQSGMLLQADIILERRSILEWLAEPLLGLRGRN